MAAPKGNKNAIGNKGGRGVTKKEQEWHVQLWEGMKLADGRLEPWDVSALEEKIASKKYAGRDIYALRVLKGDPVILKNLADKVLADLHDLKTESNVHVTIHTNGKSDRDSVTASVLSSEVSRSILGIDGDGKEESGVRVA